MPKVIINKISWVILIRINFIKVKDRVRKECKPHMTPDSHLNLHLLSRDLHTHFPHCLCYHYLDQVYLPSQQADQHLSEIIIARMGNTVMPHKVMRAT